MGFIRLHTPPGLRKSGMPDSVEMPAPVNTTRRRASAISRARSARVDIGLSWRGRGRAKRGGRRPTRRGRGGCQDVPGRALFNLRGGGKPEVAAITGRPNDRFPAVSETDRRRAESRGEVGLG